MNKDKGKKDITWERCPKHNISYPKGGVCPRCEAERKT